MFEQCFTYLTVVVVAAVMHEHSLFFSSIWEQSDWCLLLSVYFEREDLSDGRFTAFVTSNSRYPCLVPMSSTLFLPATKRTTHSDRPLEHSKDHAAQCDNIAFMEMSDVIVALFLDLMVCMTCHMPPRKSLAVLRHEPLLQQSSV